MSFRNWDISWMHFQYKFALCHGVLHEKCDFPMPNHACARKFWYPQMPDDIQIFLHASLTQIWSHLHDLVYDGVCLWPVYVVRGVGFTENGPWSRRLGAGLRFMALDLSFRFDLVSSEVFSELGHSGMRFQYKFTPCHGGLHEKCDFPMPNQACIRKFWYPQMTDDIQIFYMQALHWFEAICTI